MNDEDDFYLFQIDWNVFRNLKEIYQSLITENGNPLLNDISEISKYKREVKSRHFKSIFKFLQFLHEILSFMTLDYYHVIPFQILILLSYLRENIVLFHTRIRTIRSVYKSTTFMHKIEQTLVQLDQIILDIAKDYFVTFPFLEKEFTNDLLFVDEKSEKSTITVSEKAHIWFTFNVLMESEYSINENISGSLKFSSDLRDFLDIINNFQQFSNTNYFTLKNSFNLEKLETHISFKNEHFRIEWFRLMKDLNLIKLEKSVKNFSKEKQKIILKNLNTQLNALIIEKTNGFLAKVIDYSKDEFLNSKTEFTKTFNPLIMDLIHQKQADLQTDFQGEFKTVNQKLQNFGNQIYLLLEQLEKWLTLIKPLLVPIEKVTQKFKKAITHVRGNIDQELEDFEQYVISLEQNKYKIEIEEQVGKNLVRLEHILEEYQTQISSLVPKQFPDIDVFQQLIVKYKRELESLNGAVQTVFEQFKDKKSEIYNLIQDWDDKYQEIINRMDFSIKTHLEHIFDQFNKVLQEEHIFLNSLTSASSENRISHINSGNFLEKQAFNEEELRSRILFLDNKIEGASSLISRYKQERALLVVKLEKYLKENGLESKKCIICHKSVNVAEDNFIKCEFCGSLSHYACAVWWLNKYNSCPVCHHKYTLPNNSIYDPNIIEN